MEIDFVEMFFFERSGTVNVRKLALQVGNDRLNELLTVLSHLQGISKGYIETRLGIYLGT